MKKKMNILYINTHDSGRMFQPYGYAVPTPNLMQFTKDALIFRQAFCAGPTCSPSRAALLTGMYPHNNGMLGLSHRGFSLNDYHKHLAFFLKNYGYKSILCGIQHEAGWYLEPESGAKTIGYDINLSADNSGMREEELVQWDYENANRVAAWIREHGHEEQFFLAYGTFANHRKYPDKIDTKINEQYVVPPYPIVDTENNRQDYARFLTSASWFDRCFGQVIQALRDTGLYENTIIISTTDHGLPLPYSKCTLYDGGIGVSMIIRVPGATSNGKVSDQMVSQVDVFPTICELINIDKPEWLQGKSFAELFNDVAATHRDDIFAEINFHTSYEPVRCVRTKRYKYIRFFDKEYLKINCSNIDGSMPKTMLMENGLTEQVKPEEALYDLYYDVGERHNLVENLAYKQVLEQMRRKLRNWMEKTADPLLQGEIARQQGWKVNLKTCIEAFSKNPEDYEVIPTVKKTRLH